MKVQRSLAQEFQQVSREVRECQRAYLQELQRRAGGHTSTSLRQDLGQQSFKVIQEALMINCAGFFASEWLDALTRLASYPLIKQHYL